MSIIDEVLDGLRMRSIVFSRMTLAGRWGFAKDALSGAPFHVVLSGQAFLRMNGEAGGTKLEAGDVVILPHGDRHHLLADCSAQPFPWRTVIEPLGWKQWTPGTRFKSVDLRYGIGEPTAVLISGVFAFGDFRRNPLLSSLPAKLLVRGCDPSATACAITSLTSLLDAEILSGKAGAESIAARLADIIFIQVVRHALLDRDALPAGWLRGLSDPEIAPAIALMHGACERPWTVAALASELGMSRSRFAARFQDVVGQGPLEYLTHWRMYEAAGKLTDGTTSLASLARSAGYQSDVAFSKAFKRWAGQSPSEYRRSSSRLDGRGADGEGQNAERNGEDAQLRPIHLA